MFSFEEISTDCFLYNLIAFSYTYLIIDAIQKLCDQRNWRDGAPIFDFMMKIQKPRKQIDFNFIPEKENSNKLSQKTEFLASKSLISPLVLLLKPSFSSQDVVR